MVQRLTPSQAQKQKMSRRTVVVIAAATSSILAIIAVLFFVFHIGNPFKSKATASNPKIDARWVIVKNDASEFVIKLQIQSSTKNENLGSANYIFTYNKDNLLLPESPTAGVDYSYINFNSTPYVPGTVTQPKPGLVYVNIHSPGGTGTNISNGFVDVCTITFTKKNSSGKADIVWKMNVSNPPVFDDVFDDHFNAFSPGILSEISTIPSLATHVVLNVEMQSTSASLSWTTNVESNSNQFSIQRSADGVSFSQIDTKPASLNSPNTMSYNDMDSKPLTGTSYYRILLTNTDGSIDTSNIASIANTNSTSGINQNATQAGAFAITSITPTTFQQSTNINYTMPRSGNVRMLITNTGGKTILDIQVPSTEGENTYRLLNAGTWQPGLYIVTMYFEGESSYGKMIKQ